MDRLLLLSLIEEKIKSCQKCALYKTATNSVPGNGSSGAQMLFIGEAPGMNEDLKGIPFCGAAGKLLDELLILIRMKRENVFVANMIKHRPPNNRDPFPDELIACEEYLDEQIEIIKPKVIVTLGRFSMTKFLPYGKISLDHGKGKIIQYKGNKYIFIPMFHPAAALRTEEVMNKIKQDFKNLPNEIQRLTEILEGNYKQKEKTNLLTKEGENTSSTKQLELI